MTDDEKSECKSKEWQWVVGTKCDGDCEHCELSYEYVKGYYDGWIEGWNDGYDTAQ
jgi:hypothetical protein